jgi:subfamily B ATP-binding cassette protein MsbA
MHHKPKKKASLATVKHAFRTIIWPRRRLLLLGFVLIIVNRLAGLALPATSKFVIDNAIVEGDTSLLHWLLTGIALAVVIQATTSFFLTRLLSVEAQQLISRLRSKVQSHILFLPLGFFDNTKSGELVSRIMTDVEGVRNLVGTGFVQLLGGRLTAILALAFLIRINLLLTVMVLVPLAIFGIISMKTFGYIRPIFRERGKINAEVTGRLTESLNAIRVVKGFNAEEFEIGVFEKGVDRLFQNVKKSLTSTSFVTSAATFLLGLAAVAIMGFGGTLIMQGKMTIGDFFSFTLYLGFLIAPIVQMSNIGSQMTEAFAGLDRTEEILNTRQETDNPERVLSVDDLKGDISFENVAFSYERGAEVLRGISFAAPKGSMTALVGSSGSGKTTIAGLAASFLTPDSGIVRVDDLDLAKVRLDSYRKHLGVVLQDEFLFEGTIRENLLFGNTRATPEQLLDAAEAAYVTEFTQRFDDGLDTLVGERGVKLSGGQRQRIAIARALLSDPRILILDEATSSLDTESESFIQRSLAVLLEGRTTFVIAHRLSTIRRASQILVVEAGQIVESGTHEDLFFNDTATTEIYTYQARI